MDATQEKIISALQFVNWGWSIIPLCWPDAAGRCACGRNHDGAGKAPLTSRGVNDSSNRIVDVVRWWQATPEANIGIDLAKSGLFVIGPDSPFWAQQMEQFGLPETLTAQSGGGEGHKHYYYRKPDGVISTRLNKSKEYDIQSQGYMVAPPSLHQSGAHYTWLDPDRVENHMRGTVDLPEPPQWAIDLLQDRTVTSKRKDTSWDALPPPSTIDSNTLDAASYQWWSGQAAKMAGPNVDRSTTLFRIGAILARRGYDESTIISALQERDINLGYNKFSRRADGGIKAYADIAEKVLIDQRSRAQRPARPTAPPPPPNDDDDEGTADPKEPVRPDGPANDVGHSRLSEYFQQITMARNWNGEAMRRQLFITKNSEDTKYLPSHILFENPNLYPHREDHVNWLKYADGEFAKANDFMGGEVRVNPKVTLAERCMSPGWKYCHDHGKQWASVGYCGLKSCPSCASKVARDMARVTLPYREEGDGAYRQVWFSISLKLDEDDQDWEDQINNIARRAIAVTGHKLQERLKRRKNCRSRIYHRATSFHMNLVTTVHQKMVFFEGEPGELDADIKRIAEELGADVVYDFTTTNAETAILQMVSDSVATLASLDPDDMLDEGARHHLFAAYWWGTKGMRLIRPMDVVNASVEELPEPEVDMCPVEGCANKLVWVSDEQVINVIERDPVGVGGGPDEGPWKIPRLL